MNKFRKPSDDTQSLTITSLEVVLLEIIKNNPSLENDSNSPLTSLIEILKEDKLSDDEYLKIITDVTHGCLTSVVISDSHEYRDIVRVISNKLVSELADNLSNISLMAIIENFESYRETAFSTNSIKEEYFPIMVSLFKEFSGSTTLTTFISQYDMRYIYSVFVAYIKQCKKFEDVNKDLIIFIAGLMLNPHMLMS